MDPFLGLGSSAVAAAALGVDFIGVEIDEHYLVEAIARVKEAIGPRTAKKQGRPRRKKARSAEPGLF